jgi:hypothetical protein
VEAAPDGETLFSLGAIDVGPAAAAAGKGGKKGGDMLSRLAAAAAPGAAEMELLEEPDSDGMVVSIVHMPTCTSPSLHMHMLFVP